MNSVQSEYLEKLLSGKIPEEAPEGYGDGLLLESMLFADDPAIEIWSELGMCGVYIAVYMQWVRELARYLEGKTVLEVGAGRGLLSAALSECGVDVVCTEPNEDLWFSGDSTERINAAGAINKFGHRSDVLLISAPNGEWATKALRQWRVIGKRLVVYIGEGFGGADAKSSFFREVDDGMSWGDYIELKKPRGRREEINFYEVKGD